MWTVAILSLTSGLALGAKPASDEPAGIRLMVTASTERIPLPKMRGEIQVTVDALARRISLTPVSKSDRAGALAAKIAAHVGMLCPDVQAKDGIVVLSCRSRRIEAQINKEGTAAYLDINELRGLPWRSGADAPPSLHFDPWRMGFGQSCPGTTEAVRGECELKQGHALEAAIHFRAALDSKNRQMACVRLGDLAMSIGDPITAGGWYRRAGSFGPFGRLAESRLCEQNGSCLDRTEDVLETFDPNGLPEPLRAELLIRSARAEAYAGRLPAAMHIIAHQIRRGGIAGVCRDGSELLCRRILLEAMREAKAVLPAGVGKPDPRGVARSPVSTGPPPLDKDEHDYLEELLETYLATPSWEKGPLAVELSQAAAPLATRLGAPGFGGNLLASLAPEVPVADLADHLLLAAETFLEGENWARARIVAEYAESRLGSSMTKDKTKGKTNLAGKGSDVDKEHGLASPRWKAVFRALAGRAEEEEVSPAVRAAIETEMAATLAELKNARTVMGKAEGLVGGARDARAAQGADSKTSGAKGTARSKNAASGTVASTAGGSAKP